MLITYAYKNGGAWNEIRSDFLNLIAGASLGDIQDSQVMDLALSVSIGDLGRGTWFVPEDGVLARVSAVDGAGLSYGFQENSGAAWSGVSVTPGFGDVWYSSAARVFAFGQNSNPGNGAAVADGILRAAVGEEAILISHSYAGSRQCVLLGEADGDFFVGGYSGQCRREFVLGTVAVAGGALGFDALAKVPYFSSLKNHAAAGVKTGLNAAALAIAAHPASATGSIVGTGERVLWQALPVELWSSPKAAHLGFARGALLAPQRGVANDEFLMIDGEGWVVYRESATAAVAFAVRA